MSRGSVIRSLLWILLGFFVLGALAGNFYPIGFRVDWNIPFQPLALHGMATGTDGFVPWNYANLGSPLFYPTLAPFLGFVTLLSYVIPANGLIVRLLIFVAIIGSAEAMFRLCRKITGSSTLETYAACVVAGVSFATGPFLFSKLSQGVLQESIGYMMLPIVANLFMSSTTGENKKRRVALAMLTGVCVALAAVQPQYAVLASLVFLAIGFYRFAVIETIATIGSAIAAELYAILPALGSLHEITRSFRGETPGHEVITWAPSLLDAIRQSGYVGSFDKAAVAYSGTTQLWHVCGYVLFVIALVGFVSRRILWSRLLALAICVTSLWAAMPRLYSPAYLFVIEHVPLAMMFRESYRFVALTALLESIGLALAIVWLLSINAKTLRRLVLVVTFLIVASFLWPNLVNTGLALMVIVALEIAFTGQPSSASERLVKTALLAPGLVIVLLEATPFNGYGLPSQVQYFVVPAASNKAYDLLASRRGGGRVLYLPFTLPMGPEGAPYVGTDPTISWPPKESFGNYLPAMMSKQFAESLYSGDDRETKMESNWLDLRYIDARSWIKNETFTNTAASRTGRFTPDLFSTADALKVARNIGFRRMKETTLASKEMLLSRKSAFPSRFTPEIPVIVVGGIDTAGKIYHSGEGVAFACQNGSSVLRKLVATGAPIAVDGTSITGLIAAFAAPRYVEQPGRDAVHVNADQGWASLGAWNSWWWLDESITNSPCHIALIAKINPHRLTLSRLAAHGEAHLLVDYWVGNTGGNLRISVGNTTVKLSERTARKTGRYRWANVLVHNSANEKVTLYAGEDGDAAVAEVALIPEAYYASELRRLRMVLDRTLIIHVMENKYKKANKFASRKTSVCTASIGLVANYYSRAVACSTILPKAHASSAKPFRQIGAATFSALGGGAGMYLLNTSFSPSWHFSSQRGVHFKANGYANGWVMSRGRKIRRTIWNQGQAMLALGEVISGTFVVFVIIMALTTLKDRDNAQG